MSVLDKLTESQVNRWFKRIITILVISFFVYLLPFAFNAFVRWQAERVLAPGCLYESVTKKKFGVWEASPCYISVHPVGIYDSSLYACSDPFVLNRGPVSPWVNTAGFYGFRTIDLGEFGAAPVVLEGEGFAFGFGKLNSHGDFFDTQYRLVQQLEKPRYYEGIYVVVLVASKGDETLKWRWEGPARNPTDAAETATVHFVAYNPEYSEYTVLLKGFPQRIGEWENLRPQTNFLASGSN